MKNKEIKTNAMRQLDRMKIPYQAMTYECESFEDGVQVARQLSLPIERVYKTLVTRGSHGTIYVFVIPVAAELDLKAAARSVGDKAVSMLHVKEIQSVTGYVRGGCTAIGMKKQFETRIDSSAAAWPGIYVSGGHLGVQIELKPDDLLRAAGAEYAELTMPQA